MSSQVIAPLTWREAYRRLVLRAALIPGLLFLAEIMAVLTSIDFIRQNIVWCSAYHPQQTSQPRGGGRR
jgi:hypothetical protein